MRVLVVDDEPGMTRALRRGLTAEGFVVEIAHDGPTGLQAARFGEFDAVLLDIMLPGMSGYDVVRTLRAEDNWVPVLMVSAKDGEYDQADGLDCGADDYLVKPFSLVELDIRLKALVRRSEGMQAVSHKLRFGDLEFDPDTQEATRQGVRIALTKTGYTLLRALMTAAPRIVPRETLEHALWGEDRPDSDALRTHIHALRQAIDKPFDHAMLRTVAGVGYRLVLPDAAV